MKRMIHSRLSWYLESTRFFPEVTAGFHHGRWAMDSVIDLVATVQQAKFDGKLTAAVFLDVAKAYDSVLHSVVVAALQEAGVGSNTFSWIQDFLPNRTLFVRTAEGDTASYTVGIYRRMKHRKGIVVFPITSSSTFVRGSIITTHQNSLFLKFSFTNVLNNKPGWVTYI